MAKKKHTQLERRIIRLAKEVKEACQYLEGEADALIREPIPTSNGEQIYNKREVYNWIQEVASDIRKLG